MKTCPFCNAQTDDNAVFCPACGANLQGSSTTGQDQQNAWAGNAGSADSSSQGNSSWQNAYADYRYAAPVIPEWDHTAEFDYQDMKDNKLLAMICYLLGLVGVAIAALVNRDSSYVQFHIRQNLKYVVIEVILALIASVLCWTVLVPIAAGVCCVILLVCRLISFVSVCQGRSTEPPIIRAFTFLK